MASVRSGIGENMKDRYLFKAKRLDNGEWVQGNLIQSCDATDGWEAIIIPTKNSNMFTKHIKRGYGNLGFENWYRVDPSTICQCTGLKDKNGKLIWENNIVDFLGHKGTVVFECGSFGIVFREIIDWEEIEANICPITGCDNSLYACENDNYISLWEIYWNFNDEDDSVNTVEVIGNVFDNAELLESEG